MSGFAMDRLPVYGIGGIASAGIEPRSECEAKHYRHEPHQQRNAAG
jgi:hypothetical protein